MKPTRRTSAFALGVCAVLLLGACGSSSSSLTSKATTAASTATSAAGAHNLTIAYAEFTSASPAIAQIGQSIQQAATKVGAHLTVYNNNSSAQTTLTNAQLIATAKPSAVIDQSAIVGSVSSNRVLGAAFSRANVPCIGFFTPIPGCALIELPATQIASGLASTLATQAKSRGWSGSNTTVVLGQAAQAGPSINAILAPFYVAISGQLSGFPHESASAFGPQATKVADDVMQIDTAGSLNGAYTAMAAALQQIPVSRNIIYVSVNDDTAEGAFEAVSRAGRLSHLIMAGEGGLPAALKHLATDKSWGAEAGLFQSQWGEYFVAMAAALAKGAKPSAATTVPLAILTKQNLQQYYPNGYATPAKLPTLPPEDQYLSRSGILQQFGNVSGQ
jgi:ribose transport system substrate-binding protein